MSVIGPIFDLTLSIGYFEIPSADSVVTKDVYNIFFQVINTLEVQ